MSFSDELEQVIGCSDLREQAPRADEEIPSVDFDPILENLAFFVAEAWKDDHPDTHLQSTADFNCCVEYVTAEMAKAGAAVGGPAGLEILTGGGSIAACKVCRRVLSSASPIASIAVLDHP
ncbi:hypothetical protein K9N68_29850 [Kovacikia minuta CCNUW1]|uniref:hypothetical protein n=1 Tax=Kovacikia minuta TaxID=2931930 RepID=UPI001CCC272A|nr:hypothetical protein [Kovacikia minuta]UBF25714.1 hypothetical protein K9N68_29850 [Kovacikia minuta CCNUW1]